MGERKKMTAANVAECVCHLGILPLSVMTLIETIYIISQIVEINMEEQVAKELHKAVSETSGELVMMGLFLLLAASRVLLAFRRKDEGRLFFVTTLVQAGVFAACGALPFILGIDLMTLLLIAILYGAAMILGRIVSVIKDHRIRSIIVNLLACLVFVMGMLSPVVTLIVIPCLSLFFLLKFVFSGIDLGMLGRIVRKTYAAEIIFGLLLLIFTFSFLLSAVEPAMVQYEDALWYCFAIVTTIGFGDITAVTVPGRILSVVLGVYGIVVVALITSIIVNFYGEMKLGNPADAEEEEKAEETPAPQRTV